MKTLAPLLVLLLASSAFAQTLERLPSTDDAHHYRLSEDGSEPARFDIDTPKTTQPSRGWPTVVILPGIGCPADDYSKVRRRFVLAGYAAATFEWKGNEDFDADDWDERVAAMTDLLLAEDQRAGSLLRAKIDERKLGVVGHSLGGSVAVLAAVRDSRFKALAIFGPGGKQTDFLDTARNLDTPTIAIDGSLDRVTPPDEASGVVLERAKTRYTAHVVIKDGNHPNAPANYDTDFIRDSGRYVLKPVPIWPFWSYVYEFPIVPGITPITGREQRTIAFPYLVGWFDRFVAQRSDADDVAARGASELQSGKLTKAEFSDAVKANNASGLIGAFGQ